MQLHKNDASTQQKYDLGLSSDRAALSIWIQINIRILNPKTFLNIFNQRESCSECEFKFKELL